MIFSKFVRYVNEDLNMENLMKRLDWYALSVGIIAIITNVIVPDGSKCSWISVVTCILAAILGIIYLIYAIRLYLFQRADFDWHLINGHFLRKVCCTVILMPFLFVAAGYVFRISGNDLFNEWTSLEPNRFLSAYYHFIDPGNQHMAATKAGQVMNFVIAVLGIFLLNGLLVSSIIGWIDRRKDEWQSGGIRYGIRDLGKYRYAVVIGANEIAASVIRNLFTPRAAGEINYRCEGDNRYVVLHTSRKVCEVRAELSSHLSAEDMRRVIIYNGLRDSVEEIRNLHAEYATEIYVLGESTLIDGGETYHDAMNMRCVNLLADELKLSKDMREAERGKTGHSVRKVCKVMFEYQTTSSIFQFSDISDDIKENLVFIPFNRYESWARKVIVDGSHNNVRYMPLDGAGIAEDSDEFVHMVIVGMSKMGVAMGVETLLHAHYLNSAKARTRITFIDTNADKEMAFFKGRYANMFDLVRTRFLDASAESRNVKYDVPWDDPMSGNGCRWSHLSDDGSNFLDVEIEFIKGEIESEGVRECLRQIVADRLAKLTVAICLTHTHQAVAASLYMPIEIYKSDRLQQIWVYQRESEDILSNLNGEKNDLRYEKIRPFGMLYGEYMSDRSLYLKALLVNVAYDIANGYNKEGWPCDISDKSDKGYVAARESWDRLSVDKMWSNKYYADSIYMKIRNVLPGREEYSSAARVRSLLLSDMSGTVRTIGKALAEHESSLAVCEHNRWNIQQLVLGYSPADEELDSIFAAIDAKEDSDAVMRRYLKWKTANLHSDVCTKLKIKDDVKESSLRIHPNICSFAHLSKVDSGAQKYDSDLNNSIPKIISIVDGYDSSLRD